jgi:hypothetical protein
MGTYPMTRIQQAEVSHQYTHKCTVCDETKVMPARAEYCKSERRPITCLPCGDKIARTVKHCIVPMPKSNYIVVTDPALLVGLNTSHKGGVR